jgi:NADPH-dependent glutamate synthase beta subunit-like oxidoreductase
MARADADGALKLLLEDNPLPGVTGRVCHHPCETRCNRAEVDEALTIQALERAAASLGRAEIEVPSERGKSVAVVGSGPAGLSCAFHLRKAGWAVTVFERDSGLGGLLRTVIPAFRLPPAVLEGELARLKAAGITFRCGVDVGSAVSLQELRDSYDAVFLALGAQRSRALEVQGSGKVEVSCGLEFLRAVNGDGPRSVPGRVAVLGGGNTALDVARTVKRLGGDPVVCSPEELDEMPASQKEVAYTLAEEIQILGSVKFEGIGPAALHIKLGRRSRRLSVDQVVVAIGEEVETHWLPPELIQNGSVAADASGLTPLDGLFAGGDCTTGDRTVAHSIGEGRRAAWAIDSYLSGLPGRTVEEEAGLALVEDLNLDYCSPSPAASIPEVPVAERIGDLYLEVVRGLDVPVAKEEAGRCLGCGACTTCGNCLVFCPDLAVVRFEDERGLQVLYEYCKGCGICVTECPSGVLGLVRETGEA